MTDRYAVIGNPIAQSKSPFIHGTFAKATNQDLEYGLILGPLEGFDETVRSFQREGGRGMNVTAPFKLNAFALATQKSERAQLAGAANALKFEADGRILAENFDGIGLTSDIVRNQGRPMTGKRVLVLGAGGATRGLLLPFLAEKPAELVIANRDAAKAAQIAQQLAANGNIRGGGYADIGNQRFDIVCNATSASLRAELPPVSPEVFAIDGLAYELAYGKGLTPFLRLAQNAGVKRLADGVGMLVEQAAEAFFWWRGVRPDTRALIDQMTIPLK